MTDISTKLAFSALRAWASAMKGMNQMAEEKYRAEGKLEAAAGAHGKFEAFYHMENIISNAMKEDGAA